MKKNKERGHVMTSALTEFIGLLVEGITNFGRGIGSALNSTVQEMFLNVNSETGAITGLSTMGGVLAIFAGISLCVGFVSLIFYWVTSLGK